MMEQCLVALRESQDEIRRLQSVPPNEERHRQLHSALNWLQSMETIIRALSPDPNWLQRKVDEAVRPWKEELSKLERFIAAIHSLMLDRKIGPFEIDDEAGQLLRQIAVVKASARALLEKDEES